MDRDAGQIDILALHASARPDQPALICGDTILGYSEYNRRANRAASVFGRMGIGAGDRVAVFAHNSIAGFQVSAGLRKLGVVGVPVNFRLRGRELAYVLKDSGARAVCAGPEFAGFVDEVRRELPGSPLLVALGAGEPPTGWLNFAALSESAPEEEPQSGTVGGLGATMIYTSGTTGRPKGAHRPEGLAVERVLETISLFTLRDTDVHLMAGPGYHSAVSFFSALTVVCGGTVVIMPKFDAEEALRLMERHRVTTTFMAPTLLHRIMDLPEDVRSGHDVSSMRVLILGAAPCPFSLKQTAIEYFGEVLWEFYGSTETGVNLVLRPEDQLRKPGSAGVPAPGTEVVLLDDAVVPVAEGAPGELWVRSKWLARYHNDPDATARAMRNGFFSVGDIAYRDPDGYYYICDRRIDMIISGGVNIYPAEVESALHAHPAVRDAAVIGVPDDQWGESVKAVVALKEGMLASDQELIDWCRSQIADYKRPRSVDFVDELPRDMAGKLLKRKIREPYWAGTGRSI